MFHKSEIGLAEVVDLALHMTFDNIKTGARWLDPVLPSFITPLLLPFPTSPPSARLGLCCGLALGTLAGSWRARRVLQVRQLIMPMPTQCWIWCPSWCQKPMLKLMLKTVLRCLSPFKIGIHIILEQSVWADLSWNPFRKRIASICFGPNHSGKKFRGKIWIFEKVIFNFSAEIGFFGLTWRVTLL